MVKLSTLRDEGGEKEHGTTPERRVYFFQGRRGKTEKLKAFYASIGEMTRGVGEGGAVSHREK